MGLTLLFHGTNIPFVCMGLTLACYRTNIDLVCMGLTLVGNGTNIGMYGNNIDLVCMGLSLVCHRTNIDVVCMGLTLGLTRITHTPTHPQTVFHIAKAMSISAKPRINITSPPFNMTSPICPSVPEHLFDWCFKFNQPMRE